MKRTFSFLLCVALLAAVLPLRAQIRALNPRCRITGCVRGAVDPGFLGEDLTALQWAESEESLNRPENKPKSISLETGAVLTPEELEAFLRRVLPDCYRIKGFMHLTDGWQQVDVVEALIERQPAEARELSQLVFLSKIGPQVIRTVDAAWRELGGDDGKTYGDGLGTALKAFSLCQT